MSKVSTRRSNKAKSPWKTIGTRFLGGFRIKELELPTGRRVDYLVVDFPQAVSVIALNRRNQILLVGQYRYAVNEFSWEIPSGLVEEGENIEECARRELKEETGYSAGKIKRLFTFHPSNGACSQAVHLYLATELKLTKRPLRKKEPIEALMEAEFFPLDRALSMVHKNEIKDAATVIGVLWHGYFGRRRTYASG